MGRASRRRTMKKENKQLDALIPGHREYREAAHDFLIGKISGEEAMVAFAPMLHMIAAQSKGGKSIL